MSKIKPVDLMSELVSLCKRKGFIFQSSEIYGGINSCYDFGPLGVALKNNIKKLWWETMTFRSDIEGIDASIIMHPRVWEASGHVENFTDPLIDCKKCKKRFREDNIEDKKQCPECGGELTEARNFNLMFKTFIGPVEDKASIAYLRPETAQGIYVNFLNVQGSCRQKLPFGIAQIGKAFRNEITPGNFIFRTREFEQMEMQYFVYPEQADEKFEYWKEQRIKWHRDVLGLNGESLRFHQHGANELAHYAKDAFDIEFKYPFGWQEIEGIHNRTDYDLKQHMEYSKKDLKFFDEGKKERITPYIIETSVGVERTLLTILVNAFTKEDDKNGERIVLKLHPRVAPYKAAIFPLVKKDGMPEIARKIEDDLRSEFHIFFDMSGSIGRRYRRQDEIGTPFCFTVDGETSKDETVTIRDRDTMEQKRINISDIRETLRKRIAL
ncbi:MAG: glycine--tRNA ligase [Candidatus Aureabacteria bacterium]|nr:glycine--tRNA ligase [Candidatus Auribacterota bacterium]